MREDLLGYLLGALDADEQRQVEAELANDARLRQELAQLRARVQPLQACRQLEPPAELGERTCAFVLAHAGAQGQPDPRPALGRAGKRAWDAAVTPALGGGGSGRRSRLSLADVVVASGIFLAASLLFFPAIAQSRFTAQVAACQDNLRELGAALHDYSQQHHQLFPHVLPEAKLSVAGVYAVVLREDGWIHDSRTFICPALADAGWQQWEVPTRWQLLNAEGSELLALQQSMGGTYGYSLGYVRDGRYRAPRNLQRAYFPIMADRPGGNSWERHSANHGGYGQNVLFEDGHVEFVRGCRTGFCQDNLFLSDRGIVEPGRHANDAVIVESRTSPFYK